MTAAAMPERAARNNDLDGYLQFGGAQAVGGLAQETRHGAQGVFGHGADQRQDQDAHHEPAGSDVVDLHLSLPKMHRSSGVMKVRAK